MKLWIDDFRSPPDDSWVWAKSLAEAFYQFGVACADAAMKPDMQPVKEISFDHDLGPLVTLGQPLPDNQTTMPLARQIEEMASVGVQPPKWHVHSMNPVGKMNLIATIQSADRLYARTIEDHLWLNSPPVGREEI